MRHMTYFSELLWFAKGQPSLSPPSPPPPPKHLELEVCIITRDRPYNSHQFVFSFCNVEYVPNKQTKKEVPMILIPLESLISPLTT